MQKNKLADLGMLLLIAIVGIIVVFALVFVLTYMFAFIADNVSNGYMAIIPASIIIGAGIIALALRLKD